MKLHPTWQKGMIAAYAALCSVMQGCVTAQEFGGSLDWHRRVVGLMQGRWQLVELNGRDVSDWSGNAGRFPSLVFREDGRISGFTGASRVTMQVDTWALSDGRMAYKRRPASPSATGSEPALELHEEFLFVLMSAESSAIRDDGGTWILAGPAGVMRFVCIDSTTTRREALAEIDCVRRAMQERNERLIAEMKKQEALPSDLGPDRSQ